MPYLALATDYDGTIAHDGVVDEATVSALERLRAGSRRLILVTGRELDDLHVVMKRLDLFDVVVAENGALLYRPETREERTLADPPPAAFAERLRAEGVHPLSVGRVIVATWEPNETSVLAAIRELGLDLQITFNKGAVMVLPAGVNKLSGLRAALEMLEIAPGNCVAVGDAENDLPFLEFCGMPVAVANALPSLKQAAALVTEGARGTGVAELIDRLLDNDLADIDAHNLRQHVPMAEPLDGAEGDALTFQPQRQTLLLAGASGGGKTTLTLGLLERSVKSGFQCCVIDPEGDYGDADCTMAVGTATEAPRVEMVSDLLRRTGQSVSVNLLAIKLADRPEFFTRLLTGLMHLRARTGVPHLIVVDEAHHVLPNCEEPSESVLPATLSGFLFVTARPQSLLPRVVSFADRMIAVGSEAGDAMAAFCHAHDISVPDLPEAVETGEMLTLSVDDPVPRRMAVIPSEGQLRRHSRKYAEGKLGDDKSFFFRGPDERLNLRATNLMMFLEMGDGVDEATWEHHRRRGDYSRWIELAIKDRGLTEELARIEQGTLPADEARQAVREAIERRYTKPA